MATTVSLTSTSGRLAIARHTILSLLDQREPADRIQLNLSHEPYLYDRGVDRLPPWLRECADEGRVDVCWTENIGPYRKLLPALDVAGEEDLVITCDDDVIYGELWLGTLLEHAERHPEAIVCGQARVPVRNVMGQLQSYVHWPRVTSDGDYPAVFPIGVAGVVYKRRLLDYSFLVWREFLRVAPRQDDLWFREASARNDTPVRVAPGADAEIHEIRTGNTLAMTNATTRFQSTWDGSLAPFVERASYRIKAYAGLIVCENDRVLRAVADASQRFDAADFG